MFPTTRPSKSRYLTVVRKAHLARIVAAGALVVLPVACSSGDSDVFGSGTDSAAPTVDAAASDAEPTSAAPSTTNAPTTAASTTTASRSADTSVPDEGGVATSASGATFPVGAEVVVDFTYSAESSGQVRNPYIAVWVEDSDGNLVQTVSLWYEQSGKGAKYLNELHGWYAASGGTADSTTSGATRTAGSYTVAWDGTDLSGTAVGAGDYVLYVEAAREHGPYEITSSPITIGDTGFTVALADNGELTNVSASLTV